MTAWPLELLALVLAIFLLAGTVKGLVGLGLPTVSLALLTVTVGLREAMVLLLAPSLVANVWQALAGGGLVAVTARFWSLLVAVCLATWFGVALSQNMDVAWLGRLLGLTLSIYAGVALAHSSLRLPPPWEGRLSPAVGVANGLLTGLTGSFVVPGVMYLQALGLARELLIQAMGLLFLVSTVALGVALAGHGGLRAELGLVSALGVVPALLGMALGARLRRRLSEARFRQVFLAALLLLGLYILLRPTG